MGKLRFKEIYAAWRWQRWDRNAGSLGPELSVFPNTPALLHTYREDQFLSLPEFLNFLDSFENLLKTVYLFICIKKFRFSPEKNTDAQ